MQSRYHYVPRFINYTLYDYISVSLLMEFKECQDNDTKLITVGCKCFIRYCGANNVEDLLIDGESS